MNHLYLAAVGFGLTLLVGSFLLGGKDVHAGGHAHEGDSAAGFGWAPVTSLRFWIFLLAFGGATGLALGQLEGEGITAIAAGVVGWIAGAGAVGVIRALNKRSTSSLVAANELVGSTGTLMLPAGPDKPGKVRVDVKGRAEDFIATVVADGGDLPTGTPVLVVAEGDRGSLLVAKHEE